MTLIATQQFTDKSGKQHKKDERFDVQNEQEAQELIRDGKARKEQGAGGNNPQSGQEEAQRQKR